jgi:hypothetical protein
MMVAFADLVFPGEGRRIGIMGDRYLRYLSRKTEEHSELTSFIYALVTSHSTVSHCCFWAPLFCDLNWKEGKA